MTEYTATDKLAAIERELKYRRYVYPRWVKEGRLTESFAMAQIAVFESIAEDYHALAQKERLL